MISIHVLPSGPFATNTYLMLSQSKSKAVVIDPSLGSAEQILSILHSTKATLEAIWLTHSHWDHIADCRKLQDHYQGRLAIHIHFLDKENVISPGADGLALMLAIEPSTPTHLFREGDILTLENSHFTVLHTPGHSPGSCCFLSLSDNVIFTGDTLFKGTHGNTSFPSSDHEIMISSLTRLCSLQSSSQIILYPGHGEKSTLDNEKIWLKTYIQRWHDGSLLR